MDFFEHDCRDIFRPPFSFRAIQPGATTNTATYKGFPDTTVVTGGRDGPHSAGSERKDALCGLGGAAMVAINPCSKFAYVAGGRCGRRFQNRKNRYG